LKNQVEMLIGLISPTLVQIKLGLKTLMTVRALDLLIHFQMANIEHTHISAQLLFQLTQGVHYQTNQVVFNLRGGKLEFLD